MLTADTYMSPGALTQVMTQVRYPRRRRLRKRVKLCLNQIGTSFGVTITTIVFDKIVARDSKRLGYTSITSDTTAPPSAQISGYRAAQWTAFGFAVLCEYSKLTRAKTSLILLAALLGVIFLRGAGVIGHSERDRDDQTKESVVHHESRCDC